jgi:hypothetical protein
MVGRGRGEPARENVIAPRRLPAPDRHQPAADPDGRLHDLSVACAGVGLRSRYVEYWGRWELRIWNPAKNGAAVQVGVGRFPSGRQFTRQGRPFVSADDLTNAVYAVRSRGNAT